MSIALVIALCIGHVVGQDCGGFILNQFTGIESAVGNALDQAVSSDDSLASLAMTPGKLEAVANDDSDGYVVSDIDVSCTDLIAAYDTLELTWSSGAPISLKVDLLSGDSEDQCSAREWTRSTTTVEGGGTAIDVLSKVPLPAVRDNLHAVSVSIPAGSTVDFKLIRFTSSKCASSAIATTAANSTTTKSPALNVNNVVAKNDSSPIPGMFSFAITIVVAVLVSMLIR